MKKQTIASVPTRHRLTPGRPTTYQFQGLFLPTIEWEMKTEGIAWHEMENEPNELGTLFRNMRRQDVDPTDSLFKLLPIIQKKMLPSVAAQFEVAAQAAKEGTFTDELLAQMPGGWVLFCMGASNWKTPYFDEYVHIEAESKAADAALHDGDFRRVADLVQNNSRLSPYWSDAALQCLASATTHDQTLRPRLLAWLQLQVDVLAKWSIRDRRALQAQQDCGSLEYLLTELRSDDSAAPGALWLRAMVLLTKAKSLPKMLEQIRNKPNLSDLPSEATIKRWNRGIKFPMPSPKLEKFVERVSFRAAIADRSLKQPEVFESARWYYWAARRFDSILWFATLLHSGSPVPTPNGDDHIHAPSVWLRAEFKRLQSSHARHPLCTAA